jgi:cobalt-zinc-cadmium efflux system protein
MSAHHGHAHFGDNAQHTSARLAISLALTLAFVLFEVMAGIKAGSLALLSDAGHNFTDVVALGLSWYAITISEQPANAQKTFGYHRVGILVALLNSTTLVLIALGIVYEAYQRLLLPTAVDAQTLIGVGTIAFIINSLTAWLVMHGSQNDLNLRSAFLHLLGDAVSTLGAIAAGIGIFYTQLYWLDPLASTVIAGLILWNAWGIVRETVAILLESTPADIDMSEMVRDLLSVEGVRGVHDLHIWSINQRLRLLSAHVVTDDMTLSAGAALQQRVNALIQARYHIHHSTLQLECTECEPNLLYCNLANPTHEVKKGRQENSKHTCHSHSHAD